MADTKISALPSATTPLTGTEVLPLVQTGGNVKVAVSDLTTGRAVSALSFAGPLNGTVGATTPAAGAFTTLSATGDTSLATTPVLYGSDGAISSGRLIGRYSYRTATPTTAYFYDFNNSNTITSADVLFATKLATLINSTVTNANALTAYGTSYGTKAAGLSFISGTASDILLASVASPPLLNADINAVVVGYTSDGPRIAIQNYALNDDTANAIHYVGAVHRFYPAGSEVVNISSTGLAVTGTLSATSGYNGTVGATTPTTGAFTTVSATGDITLSGTVGRVVSDVNSKRVLIAGGSSATTTTGAYAIFEGYDFGGAGAGGAISLVSAAGTTNPITMSVGGTTRGVFSSTGLAVTGTLSATGGVTLSGGTANGVAYLDGSKVLTTGSALTFDGSTLIAGAAGARIQVSPSTNTNTSLFQATNNGGSGYVGLDSSTGGLTGTAYALALWHNSNYPILFGVNNAEQMRLTSSGLEVKQSQLIGYSSYAGIGTNGLAVAGNVGIGTSSPGQKLTVAGTQRIQKEGAGYEAAMLSFSTLTETGAIYCIGMASGGLFSIGRSDTAVTNLTLDSSGNLGLGVTPSAWHANFKSLQMSYAAFTADTNNGYAEVLNNTYASGASTYTYINTLGATRYSQQLGVHKWYNAPSGTAGTAITFTQAMTLDASGNLLVGTTSANANGGVLQLKSGITFPATQVASTDANTLDDYEEGTWTPTDASGAGLSFTGVSGTYTKVGRLVTALAELTYPITASTASAVISGLPFASSGSGAGINGYIRYTTVATSLVTFVSGGTGSVSVSLLRPGVNTTNLSMSAETFLFAVIYYV